MRADLLAELSRLFHAEADKQIPFSLLPPTDEQLLEHDRLRDIADEIDARATGGAS